MKSEDNLDYRTSISGIFLTFRTLFTQTNREFSMQQPQLQPEESSVGKRNEWEEWENELRDMLISSSTKDRVSIYSSQELSFAEVPRLPKSPSFFKGIKSVLSPKASSIPKLLLILDSEEKCPKFASVAEEQGFGHYIKYYKAHKEIEELSGSVNGLVQLQMIKKKVRETAKEFLYHDSLSKLNVPAELLNGMSDAVSACGQNTVGNKFDMSFLAPILDEVLDQLLHKVMPVYKKRDKEVAPKSNGSQTSIVSKPPSTGLVKSTSAFHDEKLLESTIENLVVALNSPTESAIIVAILQKQLCMENFEYYQRQLEARNYSNGATSPIQVQTLKKMIKDIGKEFVFSNAPSELNISSKIRGEFEESVKEGNVSISILEPVTKEVLAMLLQNTYPVYKRLKVSIKNK